MKTELNKEIEQSKVKVLIVDDIPLNVTLIKKMLGQYSFQLLTANNGKTALESIEENRPNLLLLDLMMPGIDGYEVIEQVRADAQFKDMPIIVLSALNSNDDIQRALRLGANDFITKPVVMGKLLESVATAVNTTCGS